MTKILTVAYFRWLRIDPGDPNSPDRDRFVSSRRDAAPALSLALSEVGFFTTPWLKLRGCRSVFDGESVIDAPGMEAGPEAYGHGLASAIGMAFAIDRGGPVGRRAIVLLDDDEFEDPSTAAVAVIAAQSRLGNIVGIALSAGSLDSRRRRWADVGWTVLETADATVEELARTLDSISDVTRAPTLVIVSIGDNL